MKKIMISLVVVLSVICTNGKASATILTFEGLTSSSAEDITSNNQGYGGFTWDESWYLYSDTAYPNPAQSGDYGLVNNYGYSPLGLSSSNPFTFNGVWVSGWSFNAPQQIKAQGYDASNNLVGETDWFPIVIGQNQYLSADFQNVSRLDFVGGQYFTLDDFTYNEGTKTNPVIPEPTTLTLLGLGSLGMLPLKKKIKYAE